MIRKLPCAVVLVLSLLLAPGFAAESAIVSCDPVGDMTPHCGFRNPEDLKKIPGANLLVVSEMGHMLEQETPGALALFDTERQERTPMVVDLSPSDENWADPSCAPPALLNPHGIDLGTRSDGRLALWVVNHGGRESVEVFELADIEGRWTATWRGCAIPPGDPLLNDVVALPGGGFATTHMWDRDNSTLGMAVRVLFGVDTGWVWEWSPERGWKKLEGTDAAMPNGIAATPDGRFLYIDFYLEDEMVRYDRENAEIVGTVDVPKPDNVVLAEDGRLWVAGHHHFIGNTECADIESACPLKYSVTRVDPTTMEGNVVLEHEGAPMGMATVALPVGDRLYLGSAIGDRIVSMPLPTN